jgi:CDGSH-type Zn-finger protein
MSTPVQVRCRENGPFLVSGPITVTDHLGNTFNLAGKDSVALCRCGVSKNRPFCDGSHKTAGFIAAETAPPPATPS